MEKISKPEVWLFRKLSDYTRSNLLQFYKLPYAEFACDIVLHLFIDLFISGYSKVVAPSAYGAYGGYGSYGSYGGYGHGV